MFRKLEFTYAREDANITMSEPTNAQKKRRNFGVMFTLHALLNKAGIKHENSHTMTHMGYMKTKERF